MRPLQARVITLCQQTLALGVVLAVMTPATGVVSLDIVGGGAGNQPQAAVNPGAAAMMSATVPTEAVDAEVTEVPLVATSQAPQLNGRVPNGRTPVADHVVSAPQPVSGYTAVGVTWDGDSPVDEEGLSVKVRTRTGDEWSEWQEIEYHDEHGPDPSSPEAAQVRPGTEPIFVGEVDDVQVEAQTDGASLPSDLTLAVIEPGEVETTTEAPAVAPPAAESTDGEDGLALRSKTIAQPMIYTRAQWGADERIRNKKSLRYGTISAGFVHHTVNANNYTEAQVPGMLRSIYAYHVKSRGWSDIGYNFLVDRFGRIWEGRYGGVDKPVIGAHTLGYNEYSFAMSAIGNFDTVDAPDVMLQAYGQLFAWKLSLHGVNPASTSQKVGRSTFQAINGHRDAGSTACPGRYLYAKLSTIRKYASQTEAAPPVTPVPDPAAPVAITEANPQGNLVGTAHPDLVLRRAVDNKAIIVPTGGLTSFAPRKVIGKNGWNKRTQVFASPDLTGDGIPDLVIVTKKRVAIIRAGTASGRFGKTVKKTNFQNFSLLTAVGDINGDGHNDLVGRRKGMLISILGDGKGGFKRQKQYAGFGNYRQLIGAGDVTGDGRPDVLGLTRSRTRSRMDIHAGMGGGKFTKVGRLAGSWSDYNMVVGGGDFTGDGRPDLLARTRTGNTYLLPLVANNQLGTAIGPVGNFKTMRFLSSPGQMVGGSGPELVGVVGKKLVLRPNKDTFELGAPIDTGVSFSRMNLLLNAGDVNRDGYNDVVTRHRDGSLWLYAGNGAGQLARRTALGAGFKGIKDLSAVGDVTGDGLPDLVGTLGGTYTIWRGTGTGFAAPAPVAARLKARGGLPGDLTGFDWVLSIGDMQLRGGADYVVRERDTGRLLYYNGRTSGVSSPRVLGGGMEAFNLGG
jgi:hypothetical protein